MREGLPGQYGPELAQDCVQIHGGIGVTFDHDMHLYLRRIGDPNRSLAPDRTPGAARRFSRPAGPRQKRAMSDVDRWRTSRASAGWARELLREYATARPGTTRACG